jgi:hypothetical protein
MKRILIATGIFAIVFFITSHILRHYFIIFTFENYLAIFGFGIVLLGTFIAITQIRVNYNFNRRKAAIDFIFKNIESEIIPKLRSLRSVYAIEFLNLKTGKDLLHYYNNLKDSERQQQFRDLILDIFNFYERMAIAIFKESFDEDICYDDHGFILIQFYNGAVSFIEEFRKKNNEPRIYINMEHLVQRWKQRHQILAKKKLVANRNI